MKASVVREAQERQHRRKQRSLDLTFELMVNNFRIRYTETSICKLLQAAWYPDATYFLQTHNLLLTYFVQTLEQNV